jgi:hypothetical protein
VIDLRERQGREISELEKAIATLDGVVEPAALEPLNRLRDQMKAALD